MTCNEATQHENSDSDEEDEILEKIVTEVENFENKRKSNLDETEIVNLGNPEIVKETRISIHLSPIEKEEYILFLKECEDIFAWLRRYNMKLNPSKCAFVVPTGKLLGFIISHRGMELDLSKIKAIQELPPPKRKKDMLRKDTETSWIEDCQKAFYKIKEYLSTPPILAVKGQALTDHLAENPEREAYEPLKMYFLDEEVSFVGEDITEAYDGWRMFFDGAVNFRGLGIRAVLVSEMGQHYPISAKLRFPYTNNMVEYEACIQGLNMTIDMNIQELLVIGDSYLLVHQVHANMIKVPPNELNATSSPWPFAAWGMDVIGPIEHMLQTDKEAASYKTVTKKVVTDFVKDRIVFRFGVPESIVTDNATNLKSDLIKAMSEVEIPSLRVIQEAKLIDAEWIRNRYQQLYLIDGKRMNAVCHSQLYQNKMSRAFNKRVKPRQFALGQLVLKKIFPHQDEAKGKFSPN
ncbi:uncharacterized protein [Nicotiana sylvestris]|uniref:uncharacterized protein n=1 Tax=Nicotiana sylvestris TaxID=4096 RepID=UPI00388C41DF